MVPAVRSCGLSQSNRSTCTFDFGGSIFEKRQATMGLNNGSRVASDPANFGDPRGSQLGLVRGQDKGYRDIHPIVPRNGFTFFWPLSGGVTLAAQSRNRQAVDVWH
jgi:hypothetical protein